MVTLQRVHFRVEGGDVLGAIVVGEAVDAEALQHGGAFLRPALLRVEGHDAPRDEIAFREEEIVGGGRSGRKAESQREQDKGRGTHKVCRD